MYVLQGKLQAGQKGPKWDKHANVGLYLGLSPLHARSVALVLNVTTGLASPQFHCKFDNLFETTDSIDNPIRWQTEAYFINDTNAALSPQPLRQVRIAPPPNDVTIIPQPTAPPALPTAPSEQPCEMPANEGAPAPIAHLENQQQQNSTTDAVRHQLHLKRHQPSLSPQYDVPGDRGDHRRGL